MSVVAGAEIHFEKPLLHDGLVFLISDGKKIIVDPRKPTQDIPKICPKYAQDMPKIWLRYAEDMTKICPRYTQEMH